MSSSSPRTIARAFPTRCWRAWLRAQYPMSCPVGAIPEVMEDQKEGLFVQPRDARALAAAVRRLDEDRVELRRLGRAARERVLRNHTLTRLGDRFREIYSEL